jgi:hypothetical protein
MNALDFVRVKVGGSDFQHPGDPVQGSRASELIAWHTWMDFQWDGAAWVRTANSAQVTFNDIGLGQPWALDTPTV